MSGTNGAALAAKIGDDEIARRLSLVFPPPSRRWIPKAPQRWAVGIVAAARDGGKASYIHETIASCARAGFPKPWVFAEPGTPNLYMANGKVRLAGYDGPVTLNGERCGVYPNHYLAMSAMRHSQATRDANAYLILEDDVVLAKGLRAYLDQSACWPSPDDRLAALCLFTHNYFADSGPGWHLYTPEVWYSLWGAQALAFSRYAVDEWLASPIARLHFEAENPRAARFADSELTRWANATRKEIWYACGKNGESLVSHRGEMSSVFGHDFGSIKSRQEAVFADKTTMRLDWTDPPRGRVEPLVVSTDPILNGEQARTARRASRTPICEACPHWIDAEEVVARGMPQGCDLCSREDRKPTLVNIGEIGPICKRGLW